MSTIAPHQPASTDPLSAVRFAARPARPARARRRRRRRVSLVGVLFTVLVLIGPVLGISLATWGFITANRAETQSRELNDASLNDVDRAALALPAAVETLFGQGAAQAIATSFDQAIAGDTHFTQISLYSDYAIAMVLEPGVEGGGRPAHLDQFPWRAGRVGASSPRPSTGDLDALAFGIAEVNWSVVARLASSALATTGVEDGVVTHVIIDRSTADVGLPITIRVYVTGPRSSGYVEATAAGDIIAVY